MARRPTRFERGLREIHGETLDFVEVQPRQWRRPSSPVYVSLNPQHADPAACFFRVWLWVVIGVVGLGLTSCVGVFFFG